METTFKRTIFLDLDDTLVDTYGLLITPLERAAAEEVCKIEGRPFEEDYLLSLLLELRRKNPAELQEYLSRKYPTHANDIILAREELFKDFDISKLEIGVDVLDMLREISKSYNLVLLTEGSYRIQNAKIDHLGIRGLFDEIIIVDNSRGETKERAISCYLEKRKLKAKLTAVVGNRPDREIAVGVRLGAKTVWVQVGEASEYIGKVECDVTIRDVTDLPAVLGMLFASS